MSWLDRDIHKEQYYLKLEREYFEKELLNEINDIENITENSNRKTHYNSRSGVDIRRNLPKGVFISGGILKNRETEKFVITKSSKKRLFRSI